MSMRAQVPPPRLWVRHPKPISALLKRPPGLQLAEPPCRSAPIARLPTCVIPPPQACQSECDGATGRDDPRQGLASTQVAPPCAAVRDWGMVARSPEATMTHTILLPFQLEAMTPAQLAAGS
jgi:hypothetical protein